MLYRYKQVTDQHTTHYAEPPRDAEGNIDETWYEHCTLDDGYTYVTCNNPVPLQNPLIEWELINPPAQFYQQVKNASVHVALMEKRAAEGLYMRADKHIVSGDQQKISDWVASVRAMFGLGS